MLITRDLMLKIEYYFIKYSKYVRKRQEKNNNMQNKNNAAKAIAPAISDYEARMYKIVEKTIDFYQNDKEKNIFINKCIIRGKTWGQILDDLHIERRTFFAWKREILSDAVIFALLEDLIDINPQENENSSLKSKSAAPQTNLY